jgi:hypothetical protein
MLLYQSGHDLPNFTSIDATLHMESQAFAGILVHHLEHPQLSSAKSRVMHKVPGPYMMSVRSLGRQSC